MLGWIAGYKWIKAAFMLAGALGAIHLRHIDLTQAVLIWADRISLDPHGQTVSWVLERALLIDSRRLSLISVAFFTYMVLYTLEGAGLYLEKRWAEWLTVLTTCMLIPVEVYHLLVRLRLFKVLIIVFNLTIAIYLLWRLKRDPHRLQLLAGSETPLDTKLASPVND